MDAELINRARGGDDRAFAELTEPYRRELQVHCYRLLGSLQDAEDAVQDVFLSAWQGLATFQGRASLRTWLYRIATNRCLNALRSAKRRPVKDWTTIDIEPPEPNGFIEVPWLEPYPDALLDVDAGPLGPEARYEQTEAMSLAFLTALQKLPPRPRAVLILREVLGYRAAEVAEILDSTVESVNSALKRARAGLDHTSPSTGALTEPGSAQEHALAAKFVRAYQTGDVEALVALLTADVTISMPPLALEYRGRSAVARFFRAVMRADLHFDLVSTRANGQLAFGAYHRHNDTGMRHAAGLLVLGVHGDEINSITRFDSSVLSRFGLPMTLPAPRTWRRP